MPDPTTPDPTDPAIYYLRIGAALLLAAPQPNRQERDRVRAEYAAACRKADGESACARA